MKFVLRAAVTALSIANIPPAMAGDSSLNPDTFFTPGPGATTEAPAQNIPPTGRPEPETRSERSPWLFPPIGKYLDRSAG